MIQSDDLFASHLTCFHRSRIFEEICVNFGCESSLGNSHYRYLMLNFTKIISQFAKELLRMYQSDCANPRRSNFSRCWTRLFRLTKPDRTPLVRTKKTFLCCDGLNGKSSLHKPEKADIVRSFQHNSRSLQSFWDKIDKLQPCNRLVTVMRRNRLHSSCSIVF